MDTKASNARVVGDLSRAVAYQIRAERSGRGLNQKQGYQLVGMPKGTYIRIEKAERPADVTQLEQIATAYGLTVLTLVKRATEKLNAGEVPPRNVDPRSAEIIDILNTREPDEPEARKHGSA